jgi:hypothetical protein
MLMSAGRFAIFRSETHAYNGLGPCYGRFATAAQRQRFLDDWLPSEHFLRTGLEGAEISSRLQEGCRSPGDFLKIVLGRIAEIQGATRWLESTPESGLYLRQIARDFPDARIVHIIRDGRDVALSMSRQAWFRPFPWHRRQPAVPAIAYWDWLVRKIRRLGQQCGNHYREIRFEDLTSRPSETLEQLGTFIDQRLDWNTIERVHIGSVGQPNTSYDQDYQQGKFKPVGRWKWEFSPPELEMVESIAGELLAELDYQRSTPANRVALSRSLYHRRFAIRQQLKTHLPMAHLFAHATILPWQPEPPGNDVTLRPGENLERVRAIVAGQV